MSSTAARSVGGTSYDRTLWACGSLTSVYTGAVGGGGGARKPAESMPYRPAQISAEWTVQVLLAAAGNVPTAAAPVTQAAPINRRVAAADCVAGPEAPETLGGSGSQGVDPGYDPAYVHPARLRELSGRHRGAPDSDGSKFASRPPDGADLNLPDSAAPDRGHRLRHPLAVRPIVQSGQLETCLCPRSNVAMYIRPDVSFFD
jgi:hypothetical protein